MDLWCMHASDQFSWRYWVVRYPQCPPLHCNSVMLMCHPTWIGGFREGAKGAAPYLPFFLVSRFCFENRFIKCVLILFSETLTLLYFDHEYAHSALCCMSSKVKVSFEWGGGGEGGGTRLPLSEFSGSAPNME